MTQHLGALKPVHKKYDRNLWYAYKDELISHPMDYVMIDPTWVGGISETARIAHLAQTYNLPVSMHDCTGPLTLFAGLQVGAAIPNCFFLKKKVLYRFF